MIRCFPLFLSILAVACTPASPPAWSEVGSFGSSRFQAISISGDGSIWISGTEGSWGVSPDHGDTWNTGVVPGADDLEFRDIAGISSSVAFIMSAGSGENSRIYRTRDGGSSWQEVYRNKEPSGFFDCLSFWDSDSGIAFSDAVDGDFLLVQTRDGGDSWSQVPADALPDARPGEGAFAASGTCLVTGPEGAVWFGTGASGVDTRVFRSADFGLAWEAFTTPIPSRTGSSGIFSLVVSDGRLIAALGGDYQRTDSTLGHVALTSDSGSTWTMGGDTGIAGSVYGAAAMPGTPGPRIIAVSPTGSSRSEDGGVSWTRVDTTNFWAVAGAADGTAWAVGPGGRVARLEGEVH